MVNGERIQFTLAEETARDTEEAQVVIDAQEEADEKVAAKVAQEAIDAQKDIDKASAKAKLIAGEALTEAEADTIII